MSEDGKDFFDILPELSATPEDAQGANSTSPSPDFVDPAAYYPRNKLVAIVHDLEAQKLIRLVCRQEIDSLHHMWFIADDYYGLLALGGIEGGDLDEAKSEFELFFGMLSPDRFVVETGKWYRYPNWKQLKNWL